MPTDAEPLARAQALAAELNAALAAQHASLELERRFLPLDRRDAAGRGLFEVRVAEARLREAQAAPLEQAAVLDSLAGPAAQALEETAQALYPLLAREAPLDAVGRLSAVAGLCRLARLDEARTRAVFTAAREGRKLPGFEDAVDLAEESGQLDLALRRFIQLLELGHDWEAHDLDWLLLRLSSAPGRLRLRAASLRSLAKSLAGTALPPAQREALARFEPLGMDPALALAWDAAGFSPEESLDWRAAGFKLPAQAHAWHCHGFDPQEAKAWSKAGLLPDESGLFVHGGAEEPGQALRLRRHLGDVQHYFAWYRAGLRVPETLQWLEQGLRDPGQALERKKGEGNETGPEAGPGSEGSPPAAEEPAPPAQVGAWLGWGLPGPEGFDAVPGTVLEAGEGGDQRPASFEPGEDWQVRLDRLREQRGEASQPGAWHLKALPPRRAWLVWGLIFRQKEPPWAGALDYQSAEPWRKRWARKTEEWGEEGLKAPCEVVWDAAGFWLVAHRQGLFSQDAGPAPLELPWPTAQWREALEDFCLKMEIPAGPGHWHLLAGRAPDQR